MENQTIFTKTNIFCFVIGMIIGIAIMLYWNYSLFKDNE